MTTRQASPEETDAAAGHLLSMVAQIGDLSRQWVCPGFG